MFELICDLFIDGFFILLGMGGLYALLYILFFEDINEYEPLIEYFESQISNENKPQNPPEHN